MTRTEDRLDRDGQERTPRTRRPRAPGLVAAHAKLLDGLARLGAPAELDALRASVRATVERIEAACRERSADPADLPGPSATAFRGLRELASPGGLERTRASLHAAQQAFAAAVAAHHPRESRPIEVRLRGSQTLWRVRAGRHRIEVTLTDRLIGAPEPILRLLADWCLGKDRGRGRRGVEDWLVTRQAAALPAARGALEARGATYDLDELFDELNRDYFHDRLARPRLAWSRRRTVRKLGHYTFADDRVVLSPSLDDPSVPRFAVSYVLYHELLHKELGQSGAARGRRTHGALFRRREAEFVDYDRAVAVLEELGRHWRRGARVSRSAPRRPSRARR